MSTAPLSAAGLRPLPIPLTADSFGFLQQYVRTHSGIVLENDKQYLCEARLAPVIQKFGLQSINELVAMVRQNPADAIRQQIVEAMTTHETFFFRDITQYDALRKTILPALIKERQPNRSLSVWSAASSAGQEIYSLLILLLEAGLGDWRLDLLGTDVSHQILEKARQAKYMQLEVNRGLPAAYLIKYMVREGIEWRLRDEVRRRVRFQWCDLRASLATLGPFDIVFCRNVLIYFDVETKKLILEQIRRRLKPGGYLLLGGAETVLGLSDGFDRAVIDQAVLYRVKVGK
jgi:chemotaxis protein methyltransferase CheR